MFTDVTTRPSPAGGVAIGTARGTTHTLVKVREVVRRCCGGHQQLTGGRDIGLVAARSLDAGEGEHRSNGRGWYHDRRDTHTDDEPGRPRRFFESSVIIWTSIFLFEAADSDPKDPLQRICCLSFALTPQRASPPRAVRRPEASKTNGVAVLPGDFRRYVQVVEGPHRSRSAICLPGNPDVLYPPLVLYAIMAGGTT